MYRIKWTIKHSGESGYYTTDRGLKLYKTEKAAQKAADKFQKIIGNIIIYEVEIA